MHEYMGNHSSGPTEGYRLDAHAVSFANAIMSATECRIQAASIYRWMANNYAVDISPIDTGLQSQHRNTAIVTPGSSLAERPSQHRCARIDVGHLSATPSPIQVATPQKVRSTKLRTSPISALLRNHRSRR